MPPVARSTSPSLGPEPFGSHTVGAERIGPYEVVAKIGEGGMAQVHLVVGVDGPGAGRPFALKRIIPRYAGNLRHVAMLCSEARILERLSHPNIVKFVDFGVYDGEAGLVLEYVNGPSCGKLLQLAGRCSTPAPESAALLVVYRVLSALEYLHRALERGGRRVAVVHRDVSPGNILVSGAGAVKLIDFGITGEERSPYPDSGGSFAGKPGYMAPEQLEGHVDRRSDLFAVGVVLAELLLGERLLPGVGEPGVLDQNGTADFGAWERSLRRLPSWVRAVLERALSTRPSHRFQEASEFCAALRAGAAKSGVVFSEQALLAWVRRINGVPPRSGTFRRVLDADSQPQDMRRG